MRKRDILLIIIPLAMLFYFFVSIYFITKIPVYARFSLWWKLSLGTVICWLLIMTYIVIRELIIPARKIRDYMKDKIEFKGHSVLPILRTLVEEIEKAKTEGLEKRKALKEVDYLRKLSENIIFNFPNYLFILDSDRKILFVDKNSIDWLGREVVEIIGNAVDEVLPEQILRESGFERMWNEVNSEKVAKFKLDVRSHSMGRLDRVYNVHLSPIFVNERTLFSLMIDDITSVRKKEIQISHIKHVSEFLRATPELDLDRFLFAIFTAITSGSGAGFNRAFMLLADDEEKEFRGRLGVGPRSREEAYRIWREISEHKKRIDDLLLEYDRYERKEDLLLYDYAQALRIPYEKESHIVVQAAQGRSTLVVNDAGTDERVDEEFVHIYQADSFVVVPVIVKNKVFGVILADNVYSGDPIGQESIELINIFAMLCGLIIENTQTYRELQEKMGELRRAYRDLRSIHDELLKKERFAMVGEMAATISHEIRNPLATIGGFARAIQKSPLDVNSAKESVGIIVDEVERLEGILANIMDFARPLSPALKNEDLNATITETLRIFKRTLKEKKIRLRKQLERHLPTVPLDRRQIKQVLINMMKNAIEAVEEKGTITVSSRQEDNSVVVSVSDTGVGMDEYTREHIFDPFFSAKEGGVGLGLWVCKRIIEDHGGRIEVTSSPLEGAKFEISIPLKKEEGGARTCRRS